MKSNNTSGVYNRWLHELYVLPNDFLINKRFYRVLFMHIMIGTIGTAENHTYTNT